MDRGSLLSRIISKSQNESVNILRISLLHVTLCVATSAFIPDSRRAVEVTSVSKFLLPNAAVKTCCLRLEYSKTCEIVHPFICTTCNNGQPLDGTGKFIRYHIWSLFHNLANGLS